MSGRCEHDKKIESMVRKKLGNAPSVLYKYYKESAGSQQTSKNNYINLMKRFCEYLEDEAEIDVYCSACFQFVKKRHIKDFLLSIRTKTMKDGTEKTLKAKTLNDYAIALNNFFQYLIDENIIKENPMPSGRELKNLYPQEMTEHRPVALTPDEVLQFAEHIRKTSNTPDIDVAVFMLGCRTALRATALSEIDISDIDFEKKELHVIEKNNKPRTIFLDDKSIKMIRDLINSRPADAKDMNPLFISCTKGQWHRMPSRHITYMIKKAEEDYAELGKHITPHKMRSTAITNTYEMTGSIYRAQKKAGHESMDTTSLYISSEKQEREDADNLAELY